MTAGASISECADGALSAMIGCGGIGDYIGELECGGEWSSGQLGVSVQYRL